MCQEKLWGKTDRDKPSRTYNRKKREKTYSLVKKQKQYKQSKKWSLAVINTYTQRVRSLYLTVAIDSFN